MEWFNQSCLDPFSRSKIYDNPNKRKKRKKRKMKKSISPKQTIKEKGQPSLVEQVRCEIYLESIKNERGPIKKPMTARQIELQKTCTIPSCRALDINLELDKNGIPNLAKCLKDIGIPKKNVLSHFPDQDNIIEEYNKN